MHMQGMKQLERDTTVNAPAHVVYQLFMDNAELASWAPAVDAVIDERGGDDTGLGATRTCAVTMNGKRARRSWLLTTPSGSARCSPATGSPPVSPRRQASRPRCGSRRSTRQPARPRPCSTGWSCDVSSAASLTSSSGGCARSLSGARPSRKPEPATLTRQAKARSGRGDVPGAARSVRPPAPHRSTYGGATLDGPHRAAHSRCVIGTRFVEAHTAA